MKVLIIYATKYGCSKKCAELLSEKIVGKVELININESKISDFYIYDKIIIGGPIYMGRMQSAISKFCNENIEVLKTKKIGLFMCSIFSGDRAEENLKRAFPEDLQNIAVSIKPLGGELNIEKMKYPDKFIANMVAKMPLKPGETINTGILTDNISNLAKDINNC